MREIRSFLVDKNTCFRTVKAGDKVTVRGYAALFNSPSQDMGGWTEQIAEGFFDEVLGSDVRALRDHKESMILGRTKSGTLRIGVDSRGLWYEYDDPNTSYSSDLLKSMERDDVNQSSFSFNVAQDNWKEVNGKYVRTLLKASELYDVSPVTYPAYLDTTAAKRSMEAAGIKAGQALIDFEITDCETRRLQLERMRAA